MLSKVRRDEQWVKTAGAGSQEHRAHGCDEPGVPCCAHHQCHPQATEAGPPALPAAPGGQVTPGGPRGHYRTKQEV